MPGTGEVLAGELRRDDAARVDREPRIGLAARDRRREDERAAAARSAGGLRAAVAVVAAAPRREQLHRRRRQPDDGGAAEQLRPRKPAGGGFLGQVERVVPATTPAVALSCRACLDARDVGVDSGPAGRRTVDVEAAVERRDAVGEAAQPRAAARVGTADAVVGDRDDGASVRSRDLDRHVRACAYFATFASASETT